MSGGDGAQLMMKQGRVGERPHYAFSSPARRDVRMHKAGRKGPRGGGNAKLLLRMATANLKKICSRTVRRLKAV